MMSVISLHAKLHLNEASILAKMCVTHLINLEGGGLQPPGSDPVNYACLPDNEKFAIFL